MLDFTSVSMQPEYVVSAGCVLAATLVLLYFRLPERKARADGDKIRQSGFLWFPAFGVAKKDGIVDDDDESHANIPVRTIQRVQLWCFLCMLVHLCMCMFCMIPLLRHTHAATHVSICLMHAHLVWH